MLHLSISGTKLQDGVYKNLIKQLSIIINLIFSLDLNNIKMGGYACISGTFNITFQDVIVTWY